MTSLAIDNIGLLVTNDESLGIVRDAALVIEDDRIAAVERAGAQTDRHIDAGGSEDAQHLFPSTFCQVVRKEATIANDQPHGHCWI